MAIQTGFPLHVHTTQTNEPESDKPRIFVTVHATCPACRSLLTVMDTEHEATGILIGTLTCQSCKAPESRNVAFQFEIGLDADMVP